jgi:hypothetical protein
MLPPSSFQHEHEAAWYPSTALQARRILLESLTAVKDLKSRGITIPNGRREQSEKKKKTVEIKAAQSKQVGVAVEF